MKVSYDPEVDYRGAGAVPFCDSPPSTRDQAFPMPCSNSVPSARVRSRAVPSNPLFRVPTRSTCLSRIWGQSRE